jgi:hypothetical protein
MGGSNDGNTHASIDISTALGTGFLPFFSKQGGKFLQQSFGLRDAENASSINIVLGIQE